MNQIPRILSYTGYGWFGIIALFLALGYLLALGKSAAHYAQKLTLIDKPGNRTVNYSEEYTDFYSNIVLSISTVLSVAFAALSLLLHYNAIKLSLLNIGVVLGVTVLFLGLKYLFFLLLNFIFHLHFDVLRVWLLLIYVLFGICCLCLAISLPIFSSTSGPLIALAVILGLSLILEFYTLVRNFSSKNIFVFYIFLYLCAAEILPLAVAVKAASIVLN